MSTKTVREMPKILPRDAYDAGNDILVVPVLEYKSGRPVQTTVAAAQIDVGTPTARCVSIMFHGGRGKWSLEQEYMTAQKATTYDSYGLEHAITEFERITGQELPVIKVIEPGVGIYAANKRYQFDNPWAMKDGLIYETVNKDGKVQQYQAQVKHGVTKVARIDTDGQHGNEFYEPRMIFGDADWHSLKLAALEQDEPADTEGEAPAP